jgi:WD40 repeat protein
LTALAVLALTIFAGSLARAQQQSDAPPAEPILRLNTTAHTAPIRGIATDRENHYVVTASDDKTVRVWSLTDTRLPVVLRVPIGDGNMGKLYAVAMTPDGGKVAFGGFTGVDGSSDFSIYLFDRASGALQRRISGLPTVINHLVYSSDGRLLVAALGGSNGIRVYDATHA